MKKLDRQRKITLAVLSMALVVAVYLNWQYSRTGADVHIMTEETSVLDQELAQIMEQQTANTEGDLLAVSVEMEDETVKNYGDAQLQNLHKNILKKHVSQEKNLGMKPLIFCKKP